jgi:hypothetical protein
VQWTCVSHALAHCMYPPLAKEVALMSPPEVSDPQCSMYVPPVESVTFEPATHEGAAAVDEEDVEEGELPDVVDESMLLVIVPEEL